MFMTCHFGDSYSVPCNTHCILVQIKSTESCVFVTTAQKLSKILWEKEKMLVTNIFGSVVFGENPRYCYSVGVVIVAVQKLTFCNISVITEDIYLKLGVCVHCPKSNPYYQGRQFKMDFFFFFRIMPLFHLGLLSSINHPTAKGWHAVLLSPFFQNTPFNHIQLQTIVYFDNIF